MGRPATKQARLKDGFYIELKSQGSGSIFVRRDTEEQMNIAAAQYSKMKNVIMSPHISAWSENMIERRSRVISENINRLYNKKGLINLVKKA